MRGKLKNMSKIERGKNSRRFPKHAVASSAKPYLANKV
jgi:hypothetical protein